MLSIGLALVAAVSNSDRRDSQSLLCCSSEHSLFISKHDVLGSRMVEKTIIDLGLGRTGGVRSGPATPALSVGVSVSRRRTEALLTLVVTGQEDLEEDGDQEQEARYC